MSAVREARCTCLKTVPSSPDLAFFEDRSAGTQDDRCADCRYSKVAHTPERIGNTFRMYEDGSRGPCKGFVPMVEGYEYDSYYCGHGGWD